MTGRRVSRVTLVVVAIAAALVAWRVTVLPSAPPVAGLRRVPGEIRVAYHIHTKRSDGTGSPAEVAAAAAAAGLDAVILTDHGDGTRATEPPQRIGGVLVVDAAEISTWAGHYVALGARPSPYPLGGLPEAVVEDVARLGGTGVVAHPGSAKDDLRWRDWHTPFPAIEWLNADSEWRDRPRRLWDALATYPWAPVATITALLDRPVFELREWDRQTARRPVAGLAAHDAHARIGLRGVGEPYDGAVAMRVPGYESMFRAFSNVVLVDPSGWGTSDARDAATVLAAMRDGRTYAVVTGRRDGRVVTFTARSGATTATMGGHLVPAGDVSFTAETDAPADATTTLVCDGRPAASAKGPRLTWTTAEVPGACRLEVGLAGPAMTAPWIVTNPIYARADLAQPVVRRTTEPVVTVPMAGSGEAARWVVEAAPGSVAEARQVIGAPGRFTYEWRLAASGTGPFAALRTETPSDLRTFDRVVVRGSADRPMRIWVQLRTPHDGGRRWGASIYLDETPRQVTLPFAQFLSIDRAAGAAVPLDAVTALLLVADTVHARPGDRGTVTLDELWLAR
jgi:PHP domain